MGNLKGNNFGLIKIDHHGCAIYSLGGGNEKLKSKDEPYDPSKHRFHLHHKNEATWKGQYAAEDHHEFKEIFELVKGFDGVLIASHGKGKSNEGDHLEGFIRKHHHDYGDAFFLGRISDNHKTEREILASADEKLSLIHLGNHNH